MPPYMQDPQIDCKESDWTLVQEQHTPQTLTYIYTVQFQVDAFGIQTNGSAQVVCTKPREEKDSFFSNGYNVIISLDDFENIRLFDQLGRTRTGNTTFTALVEKYVKSEIRDVSERIVQNLVEPSATSPQ